MQGVTSTAGTSPNNVVAPAACFLNPGLYRPGPRRKTQPFFVIPGHQDDIAGILLFTSCIIIILLLVAVTLHHIHDDDDDDNNDDNDDDGNRRGPCIGD